MKTICALLAAALVPGTPQDSSPESIQVLLLGTFHMGAAGDPLNPTVSDLLGERRQAELEQLAESLAEFEPTHVMVEAKRDAQVVAAYAAYLAGDYAPGLDEREQVAFRVAERAGLKRIVGVDHLLRIEPQEILQWAQTNGQAAAAQRSFQPYLEVAGGWSRATTDAHSLTEIYRAYNSSSADATLRRAFATLLLVGTDAEPVGAQLVARWYERNARIASNIIRDAQPGDRLVVLYGANHRWILSDLLSAIDGVEVVDADDYLTAGK